MADPQTQPGSETEEQRAQNPLNNSVGPYTLKRLHPRADQSGLRSFFSQLTSLKDKDKISAKFSSLFQNTPAAVLEYTKKSYFDGLHAADLSLFRSELAVIFYDWLSRPENEKLRANLTAILEERKADREGADALVEIWKYCRNIPSDSWVTVNEGQEREFSSLLENAGSVSGIAKFAIEYIDNPPKEAREEKTEKEDGKKEEEKKAESLSGGVPLRAAEAEKKTADTGGGGGGEAAGEAGQPTPPGGPQPTDVLELKQKIFSPEVREQIARFTQIGLAQLEVFHKLPNGSLQNSAELREVLSQKALAFFTTTLSEERLNLLLTSPEERFRFIRQYLWLIQNDMRTTATIENHIYNVLLKDADPAAKKQFEEILIKAGQGEDVSELISDLAESPRVKTVIENLRLTGAFPSGQASEKFSQELIQDLQQYLLAVGVSTDKIILARENVLNVLQVWTQDGTAADILSVLDEQSFAEIFGRDIPYNREFLVTLREFWIVWRADLAKHNDNILLNSESRYATQEALKLLAEKKELLKEIVAKQTHNQILVYNKDQTNIQAATEIADSRNISEELETNQQAFLQATWESLPPDQQDELAKFYGYTNATLTAPPEFTIHSASLIEGEQNVPYYTQTPIPEFGDGGESGFGYMPDTAISQSPLVRTEAFHSQQQRTGDASKLGKRIRGRLVSKANEKLLEKIAGMGGTAFGGKVGEWFAKQAATKKGRRRLALGAVAGGLSLIVPLQTIGGWVGGFLGGIGGFFVGGPWGVPFGSYLGSWIGYGIDSLISNWLNKLFGGGEEAAAGPVGNAGAAFSSGGAGGANLPPAQTGTAAAAANNSLASQAVASTGSQAVLATVGLIVTGTIFSNMVVSNALLADFPQVDPLSTFSPKQGKVSEYLTIEKRVFIDGCPGNKCENPDFPITVTYSVIIRPKDDYAVTLQEVSDTLRVIHSDQAWEEEGKTAPEVPETTKTLADFPEIYAQLGEELTIPAGGQIEFSYEESFNENYNHAMILNTLDVFFSFSDEEKTGEDNAITGEIVFIGNYSQGAGCWPTDGYISQLPDAKGEPGGSHAGIDAFDIGNVEGTPVYKPFPGKLCFGEKDDGYGNHLILETPYGRMVFGHFRDMILKRPGECLEDTDLPIGAFIGYMGHTGNVYSSSGGDGTHLHIELEGKQTSPSALGALLQGGLDVQVNDPVRTCYSGTGQ